MFRYLLNAGMTAEEYVWFPRPARPAVALHHGGPDYYITNEHIIKSDGTTIGAGDVYGYYVITRQYYDRYRLPVMHTETNRASSNAVEWLWKEWMNLLRLREDGVPVVGFTWFGLVDMKDWDTALTHIRGKVNPVASTPSPASPERSPPSTSGSSRSTANSPSAPASSPSSPPDPPVLPNAP